MTIHKEGYTTIFFVLIILSLINAAVYFFSNLTILNYFFYTVSFIFFLLIVRFFRKPARKIKEYDDKLIYAPADGTVVVVENTFENEFLNNKTKQISIFMSPNNVHINWIPCSGIVKYFKYHKGKHFIAHKPKSSVDNERTTIVIETKDKIQYLMRQVAGAVARRIVYYAYEGKEFKQGEELGFIKFGSRVDLFLPVDTEIFVKLDDKTIGNKTLIGKLP